MRANAFAMAAQADPAGCLYAVLGVRRDADTQTIRSAYRRLAVRYHPDKNREPGAEEMFKAVARAYEVLVDADSRALYDAYGMEGVQAGGPPGGRAPRLAGGAACAARIGRLQAPRLQLRALHAGLRGCSSLACELARACSAALRHQDGARRRHAQATDERSLPGACVLVLRAALRVAFDAGRHPPRSERRAPAAAAGAVAPSQNPAKKCCPHAVNR